MEFLDFAELTFHRLLFGDVFDHAFEVDGVFGIFLDCPNVDFNFQNGTIPTVKGRFAGFAFLREFDELNGAGISCIQIVDLWTEKLHFLHERLSIFVAECVCQAAIGIE